MRYLKLHGWQTGELDKEHLREAIKKSDAPPAVKTTAIRMLFGLFFTDKDWSVNTLRGYKVAARKLMRSILLEKPEFFGLERIDPAEIYSAMSSQELADFCRVPISRVYELARGAPGNGLPVPEWPVGRTLKGRGWRFPPHIARVYTGRLIM